MPAHKGTGKTPDYALISKETRNVDDVIPERGRRVSV